MLQQGDQGQKPRSDGHRRHVCTHACMMPPASLLLCCSWWLARPRPRHPELSAWLGDGDVLIGLQRLCIRHGKKGVVGHTQCQTSLWSLLLGSFDLDQAASQSGGAPPSPAAVEALCVCVDACLRVLGDGLICVPFGVRLSACVRWPRSIRLVLCCRDAPSQLCCCWCCPRKQQHPPPPFPTHASSPVRTLAT